MVTYKPSVRKRFLAKVNKEGLIHPVLKTRCWQWLAGLRKRNGYGQFWAMGNTLFAHRVSFEMYVGEIPAGLLVLHKCDNPLCVNPEHLFIGNHDDNAKDRNSKGRQAKGDRSGSRLHPEKVPRGKNHYMSKTPGLRAGENHGRAILCEKDVLQIRKMKPKKLSHKKTIIKYLTRKYGVKPVTLRKIWEGKLWRHLL